MRRIRLPLALFGVRTTAGPMIRWFMGRQYRHFNNSFLRHEPSFFLRQGNMKRLLLSSLAAAMLAPFGSPAQPAPFYINPANVLVTAQVTIDAVNFVNFGSFNISVIPYIPFETFDTLNYTNFGTMSASPGWRFDLNSTADRKSVV